MFIATTLPTPLYVIYEHTFGFSRVTLTLIYAVYVVGNLVALLLFGRTSDVIGRRMVSSALRNCRERHILRAWLSRQPPGRKRNRTIRSARRDGLDLFRR